MRLKLTIFLLIANLLVFYAVQRLDRQEDDAARLDSSGRGVLGMEAMEIDRMEIAGKAVTPGRVLERKGKNWQIVQPIQWPANGNAVQRIVTQLQFLEKEVSFPVEELKRSGQTLADYGLQDPNLVLTFSAGPRKAALKVGEPTNIGNRLYVLNPQGDKVLVVSRDLLEFVKVDLADLRSPFVFEIPLFEARALNIRQGGAVGQRVGLTKEGEKWRFEAPVTAAADSARVAAAINALNDLQAESFVEASRAEPEVTGLGNPVLRVTLQGNQRRQTLMVGSPVGEGQPGLAYAKLEENPTVFTVQAEPLLALRNAVETLRERRFVEFEPSKVTSLRIAQGDFSLLLQKLETGAWQVVEKDGALAPKAADAEVMQTLLHDLRNLEAVRFVTDAPAEADMARFGLNAPLRAVQIAVEGVAQPRTLLIGMGREKGEKLELFAKMADSPTVYAVSPALLDQLRLTPLHYRTRMLIQQPAGARVQGLKLTDLKSGKVLMEESIDPEKTTWPVFLERQPPARRNALLDVLDSVRKLEVEAYLRNEFVQDFQLDKDRPAPWRYKLEATVHLPGSDRVQVERVEIFLTERLGGRLQIGGSPQAQMIFTLRQKLIDALHVLTFAVEPPAQIKEGPAGDKPALAAPPPVKVEGVQGAAPSPTPGNGVEEKAVDPAR